MQKDLHDSTNGTRPFRYAIGMLGTSIPINMFKTYAAVFYVVSLNLNTKYFSLILLVYTFIDAIDNPIYGYLSDRTRTPWGRRRPWLLAGTPLLALAFILFYSPPVFDSQKSMFIYVLLMYSLTGTLDSLINANYGALFPELFKGNSMRSKTVVLKQIFQLLAMVISIALTPIVTKKIGYSNTAIVYGIFAILVIFYSTLGCKENPDVHKKQKPKFLLSFRDILKNPKFWVYGFTNAFYTAALSLVMQAVPFFVIYSLHIDESKTAVLLGTVLGVAILSIVVWGYLINKLSLIVTWRLALVCLCLSFIPLYFVHSFIGAVVGCSLIGLFVAGVLASMDMVAARIIDEDIEKHGIPREGLYSSTMGFMNKLSGLFVSSAYLLVNLIYGFESGDITGPNPDGASRFLLVIFPFGAMIISSLMSFAMRLKREKEKAIKEDNLPIV